MENDVIPVCFCADDKFIPYTAVTIQSIMENANPDTVYKLYILFSDISEENQKLLKEQVNNYKNFSVDFIDMRDYVRKYCLNNAHTGDGILYSKEIYYRLLIPYTLNDYKKVIYLDSDIVCLTDIAKLIDDDNDYMIKAVRDYNSISNIRFKEHVKKLGLNSSCRYVYGEGGEESYINSGILVFDIYAFRQKIPEEKLFDYISIAEVNRFEWPDQDILNIVCEGNVKFLGLEWNVMKEDVNIELKKKFKKEYNMARKNPLIIHYGGVKPWNELIITRRTKYFWEFARRTMFADIIYLRLKNIALVESSNHVDIYNDIEDGRKYGLKFIVRCGLLWLKMKLETLKERIFHNP
jgi:lipopolysaccharide biosynthesis glycosyltransferase